MRRESIESRGAREGAASRVRVRAVGRREIVGSRRREYGSSRVRSVGRGEAVGSPLREYGGGEEEPCHHSDHSIPAGRPARHRVTAVTQVAGADDSEARRGGER